MKKNFKTHSTPIGYYGSKRYLSNALIPILKDIFPRLTKIASPFLGAGTFEINLANSGYHILGYDAFKSLVNFWNYYLESDEKMLDYIYGMLRHYLNNQDDLPNQLILSQDDEGFENACRFWLKTRLLWQSFPKAILESKSIRKYEFRDDDFKLENGGFVIPKGFWRKTWEQSFKVECQDYQETIKQHQFDLLFLDPPYLRSENNYCSTQFSHERLRDMLLNHPNWLLSYSYDEFVKMVYCDFPMICFNRKATNVGRKGSHKIISDYLIGSQSMIPVFERLSANGMD